jgi:O-antigen/teichoic acid export membrane protein
VLRNIGSNWVLTAITLAAAYLLTPFVIRTLGPEGYGTWTLVTSMTGYISLLALGVPMASVRYLAQYVAEGDRRQMNQVVASCAALYLALGAAAVLLGAALSALFVAAYDIPPALQAEAGLAFGLMVLYLAAGFIGLLPEGLMAAHHDFVLRNVIRLGGVLWRLGLTVGLLSLDTSLVTMALIQIACLGFDLWLSVLVIRRRYPGVRLSLAAFDWGMIRRIFSFSLYVLLLNAGARLSFDTDALVIGAFLGVSSIPFYVVANSLVVYLMDFLIAIAAVVSPMATKLGTEGSLTVLREMFLKWSKVALSVTVGTGLFLIVLGPTFIGQWIDPSFEGPAGAVLQILVVSSLVFLPVRGVAVPILMGLGKPKMPTIAYASAGLLNLGLSVVLVGPLGLPGVALGTAIPNVLFALVVTVSACRQLGIALGSYVRYVVPRTALGALPSLGLLLWFRVGLQVHSMSGLVAAGVAMALLFGVTWVFFVYRDDPYVDVRARLVRLGAWSRA